MNDVLDLPVITTCILYRQVAMHMVYQFCNGLHNEGAQVAIQGARIRNSFNLQPCVFKVLLGFSYQNAHT